METTVVSISAFIERLCQGIISKLGTTGLSTWDYMVILNTLMVMLPIIIRGFFPYQASSSFPVELSYRWLDFSYRAFTQIRNYFSNYVNRQELDRLKLRQGMLYNARLPVGGLTEKEREIYNSFNEDQKTDLEQEVARLRDIDNNRHEQPADPWGYYPPPNNRHEQPADPWGYSPPPPPENKEDPWGYYPPPNNRHEQPADPQPPPENQEDPQPPENQEDPQPPENQEDPQPPENQEDPQPPPENKESAEDYFKNLNDPYEDPPNNLKGQGADGNTWVCTHPYSKRTGRTELGGERKTACTSYPGEHHGWKNRTLCIEKCYDDDPEGEPEVVESVDDSANPW
jgi:hypothetical protein